MKVLSSIRNPELVFPLCPAPMVTLGFAPSFPGGPTPMWWGPRQFFFFYMGNEFDCNIRMTHRYFSAEVSLLWSYTRLGLASGPRPSAFPAGVVRCCRRDGSPQVRMPNLPFLLSLSC